jgi:hypothetical protein
VSKRYIIVVRDRDGLLLKSQEFVARDSDDAKAQMFDKYPELARERVTVKVPR